MRYLFGGDNVEQRSGTAVVLVPGHTASIFTDAAAATPATDLLDAASAPVTSGTLTLTAYSQVPLFYGPDTVDVLYFTVDGGPVNTLYAIPVPRLVTKADDTDVQTFTASGTWTKPAGAQFVHVYLVGAGGGGGSGRRGAAATVRCGGGGGAGGAYTDAGFPAAALPSTVAVTVGTTVTGGAAIGVDSTDGATGVAGGQSQFGSLARANGGSAGAGGTATTGTAGNGGSGMLAGGNGGTASTTGTAGGAGSSASGSGGGGSGGGITSANAVSAGGASGFSNAGHQATGSGGAANSTTPALVSSQIVGTPRPGNGGPGSGAGSTQAAAAGQAGGVYGGGGGGGGASLNGFNSGAGGAGAAGIVVVVTAF
jgi:hypothetical protein